MIGDRPKSAIRLVAVDLDGTLLDDSKRVSDRTAGAFRCLAGSGVRVVIASARPPRSVRHVYAGLGLDTWQINYNGALIWDEPNRRVVSHRPMDPGVVRGLVDLVRGLRPAVGVSCEILDRWCTDRFNESHTTETARLFQPDVVAPVEQFCTEPVTKLLLQGAPQVLDAVEPALRAGLAPVSVLRSDPDLIQITHASVSKGAALREVCDHYAVPMAEVMAVGDALNDIPMLEAAGVAVAMDNALPAVKRAADWVAPSNNDHGVHAALARYGLC